MSGRRLCPGPLGGRRAALLVSALLLGAGPLAASAAAAPMRPILGRSAVVSRVSGRVLVKVVGTRRYTLLTQPRRIAMGSTVDATHGRARLVTAGLSGAANQSGVFWGGAFVVTQARSGLTDLRLVGGRTRICGQAARGGTTAARAPSSSVIRLLHAQAHGQFRTSGRFSAATVRGTQWETVDRCNGTETVDRVGAVNTTTGQLSFVLQPGQTATGYCFPPAAVPRARVWCEIELSEAAKGLFGFGVALRTADQAYDVCVTGPSGTVHCRHFLLSAPDSTGLRLSAVVCTQEEGPGQYSVAWFVAGKPLGAPLPFTATLPAPSQPATCVHS